MKKELKCAKCGQPIEKEPGGLDYAKIAGILGASRVEHVKCPPKKSYTAEEYTPAVKRRKMAGEQLTPEEVEALRARFNAKKWNEDD